MANNDNDEFDFLDWEDYPDERDPIQQTRAAIALSDQMRNEEDLLAQQTAEEARLEREWRQGPTSGVMAPGRAPAVAATPGQYEYGQVMPTSRGFMYVGNPIPGSVSPPIPTDQQVWQQQVQQQVADTGNIPIPEPAGGWFGPGSVFTPNVPSVAQQQYDMTQQYLKESDPMRRSQHLAALIALTGRGRSSPVADQIRMQQEQRLKAKEDRLAGQVPSYVTRARSSLQSQIDSLTQQRIAELGGDNPEKIKALDNEIKSKQSSLNDLDKRWMPSGMASTTSVPTATAAPVSPAVEPPSRDTIPVVKTKAEYDALPKGTVYIGKDGRRALKR